MLHINIKLLDKQSLAIFLIIYNKNDDVIYLLYFNVIISNMINCF